uniref:Uncharacterized protein n=1 Tax=Plectus sambesii TaxID=2011161 RepID=A0A914VBG6_9BILA
MTRLILFILVVCFVAYETAAKSNGADRAERNGAASNGDHYFDGKTINVPLGEKGTHDLYLHWMEQAISGLMAAIANSESERISDEARSDLFVCSKNATNIPSHAKCVMKAIEAQKVTRIVADPPKKDKQPIPKPLEIVQPHPTSKKSTKAEPNLRPSKNVGRFEKKGVKRIMFATKQQVQPPNDNSKWVGGFRVSNRRMRLNRRGKRQIPVLHATSYQLSEPGNQVSAFGEVADFLTEAVRGLKGKRDKKTWQGTFAQLKMQTLQQRQRQVEREAVRARFDRLLEAPPEQL